MVASPRWELDPSGAFYHLHPAPVFVGAPPNTPISSPVSYADSNYDESGSHDGAGTAKFVPASDGVLNGTGSGTPTARSTGVGVADGAVTPINAPNIADLFTVEQCSVFGATFDMLSTTPLADQASVKASANAATSDDEDDEEVELSLCYHPHPLGSNPTHPDTPRRNSVVVRSQRTCSQPVMSSGSAFGPIVTPTKASSGPSVSFGAHPYRIANKPNGIFTFPSFPTAPAGTKSFENPSGTYRSFSSFDSGVSGLGDLSHINTIGGFGDVHTFGTTIYGNRRDSAKGNKDGIEAGTKPQVIASGWLRPGENEHPDTLFGGPGPVIVDRSRFGADGKFLPKFDPMEHRGSFGVGAFPFGHPSFGLGINSDAAHETQAFGISGKNARGSFDGGKKFGEKVNKETMVGGKSGAGYKEGLGFGSFDPFNPLPRRKSSQQKGGKIPS